MRRQAIMAALLLASACTAPKADPDTPASSADTPTATPTPTSTPSPPPATRDTGPHVATLEGEWRVAAIDGADFNEDYGIAVSATAGAIRFDPGCAGRDRSYEIDGLAFRAWPSERQQAICEIGLPQGLRDMWRAIDAATRIERTPSNGVLLSGGGHSLLLFSQ